MNLVYTKYFQKSKIFLYPLLGIVKGSLYTPINTYLCWEGVYNINDSKFICVYENVRAAEFTNFQNRILKKSSKYHSHFVVENKVVYVFNFLNNENYNNIIAGKYSRLSKEAKDVIMAYFKTDNIRKYIDSFLYPEQYHKEYASYLDVELSIIQSIHETCSIPDIKKETLTLTPPQGAIKNKLIFEEK